MYVENQLIHRVKTLGSYKKIPSGFWIIGVRSADDKPDKFDDHFYLMKGEKMIKHTTGTTNAGVKILRGGFLRYTKKGAAVLASNYFYENIWQLGKHKGIVPALLQIGGRVAVYRDNNLDYKADEKGIKEWGFFGINFHSASNDFKSNLIKTIIGGWSAGCQVCNNLKDYREIITTIKESEQKNVSYCLLKEFSI